MTDEEKAQSGETSSEEEEKEEEKKEEEIKIEPPKKGFFQKLTEKLKCLNVSSVNTNNNAKLESL